MQEHCTRFEREVKIALQLRYPNIVPILGSGCVDRVHYYIMKYIEGITLEQLIRRLAVARYYDCRWSESSSTKTITLWYQQLSESFEPRPEWPASSNPPLLSTLDFPQSFSHRDKVGSYWRVVANIGVQGRQSAGLCSRAWSIAP